MSFNADILPVRLIDRSFHNDICPSFYFYKNSHYYILWTDSPNKNSREIPESKRYTLSLALNEGDDQHPEIYADTSKPDLIHTNNIQEIKYFIERELRDSTK